MLQYLFQIIIFQLVFLLVYEFFLKRETFFNWNRAYLLVTSLLSLALPFIKFQKIKDIVPNQFVIGLPEVFIGQNKPEVNVVGSLADSVQVLNEASFTWSWMYLIYLGMAIAALIFIIKAFKLAFLIKNNPKRWKDDVLIVKLSKSNAAFSFFHYVFIGENIKEDDQKTILRHELVHVNQKHSLDLILFELLKIAFWFNPLIYIYQSRIADLHEFIADKKVLNSTGKSEYYQNLLSQIFEVKNLSFINSFYKKSLIKKRIVMLQKSKSKQIRLFKYFVLVPLVFSMLIFTSACMQEDNTLSPQNKEDTLYKDLSDEELIQKFYAEIETKFKSEKGSYPKMFDEYMPDLDKYINTRVEYLKFNAFTKYIIDSSIERKRKNGTLTDKDFEMQDNLFSKHKTYQEYLDWLKTDEAKERWESNIKDGVLRLVVDDAKNLTPDEKERLDEKQKLIENDDYFHSLLITDGKTSMIMGFEEVGDKTLPKTIKFNKQELSQDPVEVPFAVIDEVPIFPGCENLNSKEERKKCFAEKISQYVNDNFNTEIAESLGLEGRQRIIVFFKIGADGLVKHANARAPHPYLEKEAIRIIKALPKVKPAKQNGMNVMVPYSMPIIFQVSE